MEDNSKKQLVLSVAGIAVLIVAIVGVSFAFFSYAKTGTTNNTLTTRRINFEYTGQNQLSLTNQFPKEISTVIEEDQSFNFTITGNIPTTAKDVTYKIYAEQGDVQEDKTRMDDSSVRLYLKKNSDLGATTEGTFGDATQGGLATGVTNSQVLLATGSIAAGANETHSYSLFMWVDKDIKISDTDNNATYCASPQAEDGSGCETSKPVYSNLYYSLKVKVEANDTEE